MSQRPYTVVLIIPTGIGAAIGGYAGDGLPVARAIAQVCDRLITHPNVLNGAQLYWPLPNGAYVEGFALDQLAQGRWGLRPVHSNRVGLVLDRGIEPDLRLRHLQAADATRATLGLTVTDPVVTDEPLEVSLCTARSGATWGTIQNIGSLFRAVEQSLTQTGAQAIALVARFPDDCSSTALTAYRHGQGVDPLAGAEAVISHLVVREFQIPCAHAPALSTLPLEANLSPRSAAEEMGYTFLPCVLVGLSQAPQFVRPGDRPQGGDVWAEDIDAVIVPESACGSPALLSLSQQPRTRIITVANNPTRMKTMPQLLGIKAFQVNSYLEAIGLLVIHRAGIDTAVFHPNLLPLQTVPDLRD